MRIKHGFGNYVFLVLVSVALTTSGTKPPLDFGSSGGSRKERWECGEALLNAREPPQSPEQEEQAG